MEPSEDPVSLPVLDQRRAKLALAAFLGIFAEVAALVVSAWAYPLFPPWTGFLPLVLILAGVVGWFAWQVRWTLVQLQYKDTVAVPAVAAWRPGWTLKPDAGLGRKVFEASGLCTYEAPQYHSEDLARGPVEGVKVCVAEVVAARTSNPGSKNSKRQVLFQGALVQAVLGEKPWEGRFFVRPKGVVGALSALPGNALVLGLDPDFDQEFVVTWTGKGPAPAAWTPALCQALAAAHTDLGLNYRLSWDGATLYAGTTSLLDLWEPPLWTRLDDGRRIERALRPLELAERLVRAFQVGRSPEVLHGQT